MLKKKHKKYIYLFAAAILIALQSTSVFAEDSCLFRNNENTSGLNVIKDLNQGWGREWYVDAKTGNNEASDGTSLKSPFKTIGMALSKAKPGDVIVISAGLYRERLYINKKGAKNNPIIIGPRGNGEVIIDCSEKISGWEKFKGNIYKADCSFAPIAVVVDEMPLFPEFSVNNLGEGKWYYDKNEKTIYLYTPDGKNPKLCDVGVITSDKYQNGVNIHDTSYIVLYGLTIRFAGGCGVTILGSNNRIEKCNIKYNGNMGIRIFSYKEIHSSNNKITKNHVYHNFIRNWPRGRFKSGSWGSGIGINGSPDNYLIANTVHKNGGEGILTFNASNNTLIKNNISYDNWSVNIYIDGPSNCTIENNLVFCNEPTPKDLYNNGDRNPNDGKNLRRLRAEGIMTADEKSPANFKNAKIINNIIINCRRGITHYAAVGDSGLKNVLIANNTIILPNAKGTSENYIGIRIPYNNGNNKDVLIANNIITGKHPSTYLLDLGLGIKGEFNGLTFSHNLWYHTGKQKPFHIGSWTRKNDIDFRAWQNLTRKNKQGKASLYVNPKFVNTAEDISSMVKPASDSPAVNAGIVIDGLITDYYGNIRSNPPDMGAIELIKDDDKE